MEKKNYLSNKEILKEIHKSKISYSWIKDKIYSQYDGIVRDMAEITDEIIEQAIITRAKRISSEEYDRQLELWDKTDGNKNTKPRLIDCQIDPETVSKNDIVIRLMTFDHIPINPKKENPKTIADKHIRCNFPPFKQYAFINSEWTEVVRSHWMGDLETGQFSLVKGKMTNKLGSMMLMLINRYSMRANWRNYSYIDEMRSTALVQLAQTGLYFDESKGLNPFAYMTSVLANSFLGVLNNEKRVQSIRDDLLQDSGYMPSFTRQFADEENQQNARKADYDQKLEQEQKDFGING